MDARSKGKLVVAILQKGHFTTGGHFTVLRGVQDGEILVADPASYSRSQKLWDLPIIRSKASKRGAEALLGDNATPAYAIFKPPLCLILRINQLELWASIF